MSDPRVAVIFNPSKFDGDDALGEFRAAVIGAAAQAGYASPTWFETTVDDAGHAMTAEARDAGFDLVLAAGGDGTVRVVASGLSGSDIPLGVLPMGTANLLARNLGLPPGLDDALEIALQGADRRIDLVRVEADGAGPTAEVDHFAVMAGIGADAVVMEEANPTLKKVLGSAAYVFSAAQNADHPPLKAWIKLDDQEEFEREAILLLVGNVGRLQADIPLIPGAEPDDGLLDLLVAAPQTDQARLQLLLEVLFRRHDQDDQFDLLKGRRVEIRVEREEAFELDGDPAGHCSTLVAEIVPHALTVRVPHPQT